MQKKSEVEKRKKKRPVGRPCKAPQQRMSQSAKSTALMTHEEDREMRLRWRDEGMKVPFGRWLAAEAMAAAKLREQIETQEVLNSGRGGASVDVAYLGQALSASLGAVVSRVARDALCEAHGNSTRQIADALVALAGEVADAVTQCLLPHVMGAHSEAREARRLVEEALGISRDDGSSHR